MPRVCLVCIHAERAAIDAAIVRGEPYRRVSALWGVSGDSAKRHKANHIPERLAEATQAEVVATADALVEDIQGLKHRAIALLDTAETGVETVIRGRTEDRVEKIPDLRAAVSAIREIRGCIELFAKVEGRLKGDAPAVSITAALIASPEWIQTRWKILEALRPFPEARLAVVEALRPLAAEPADEAVALTVPRG